MTEQLFKFLMFTGIIVGFVFLIYTNTSKNRKDKSIIYLNLFVLFFTINNLQITLADYNYVNLNFFERKLLIPWYALIIPCFYTFVVHYLRVEKKIKSFVLNSIFLFVIEIIIRIVLSQYFYNDTSSFIVAQYAQFEEIVNLGFTIFLFLKVVYIFLDQTKLQTKIFQFDNMSWLKQFFTYGFIIIILWIIAIVFNLKNIISPNISIYYPLRLSSTLLIYWIGYCGFFKYNLLIERIELRKEINNDQNQKNEVILETVDSRFLLIQNIIIEHKMFLEPDLAIEDVAKKVKKSAKNVSQILQEATNFNFPDYINSLRIEKAKKFLVSAKYSKYTVVSIGLECGFNSKSTFYRAFKKATGTTPTEFRLENHK
jgi:AraC-like DNA-binding protein